MIDNTKGIESVKEAIEGLIAAGTTFNTQQLELIYHHDLKVIMVDESGGKMLADKGAFKSLFESKKKNNEPPLNTWAEYNHIEATDEEAHVVVTRKVNLTGEEQKLTLSIDLVYQSDRWQVIREVIFARPLVD